jgi:hypothetical protein
MTNAIPMRQLSLSISYSFGKSSNISVKTARRTITNDDILNAENATAAVGQSMMTEGGM